MKKKIDFQYGQNIKEIKHDLQPNDMKDPVTNTELLLAIDGPTNSISIQLITALYRNEELKKEDKAEDVVHFFVQNQPKKKLNKLYPEEIMHLLTESTRICVEESNKIISKKYSKKKKLNFYEPSLLNNLWNQTVNSYDKPNPYQGLIMGEGGDA